MNLETQLEPPLWESIRTSYEARNYTVAILDAIHCLSELIREHAGLEGDGVTLVGDAFGGKTPRLKVNRLQTESEQNVQRGIEALLRGIYQAIRNPRSHGRYADEEKDAVAIILFIDYLVRIVGQSQAPFSLPVFVGRILDPDFVPKKRYAELLVSRIPENKRLATCLEVFSRRSAADGKKVYCFFEAILAVMSEEDKREFLSVVSDELAVTEDDDTIRFVLQTLPPALWPELDEAARLRIENKLINSTKDGRWTRALNRCLGGAFGTWINNIHEQLTLKDDLWQVLVQKLASSDREAQDYVFCYFTNKAAEVLEKPPSSLVRVVNNGLKAGDVRFKEAVELWSFNGDDWANPSPEDPWVKPFQAALASFQDAGPLPPDDDIPF